MNADLFEEASHQIRSDEDLKQTAESLRKAVALSSNHNTIKAWQAMAVQEAAQSNLGVACANLQVQRTASSSLLLTCSQSIDYTFAT